jgi:tellurium resistance protein TerZ
LAPDEIQPFDQNPPISLAATNFVNCGLSWDKELKEEDFDLDISGVLFNGYGKILDAVYFNNLASKDGSINLTQDSRDGVEGGEDEQLMIDLSKVHQDACAVVISVSCHSSHMLNYIQSGLLQLRDHAGAVIHGTPIANVGNSTSAVMYCLFRDPADMTKWCLKPIFQPCDGRTFEDFKEVIRRSLCFIINPALMEEARYDINNEHRFNMDKGNALNITGVGEIFMGLGWDPEYDGMDLDASCVMMEEDRVVETVFFGHLTSKDGSIRHSGDNISGEGAGDDERIYVELNRVPLNITALIFVVNIYTNNRYFSDVDNEFVRVVNCNSNKTMCKYKLDDMSTFDKRNAMVVCKLFRFGTQWRFLAVGEPEDGRRAQDMLPRMPMYAHPGYMPVVPKVNRRSTPGHSSSTYSTRSGPSVSKSHKKDKKSKHGKKDKKSKKDKKDKKHSFW